MVKKNIYISLLSLIFFIVLIISSNSTFRTSGGREAENQYSELGDFSNLREMSPWYSVNFFSDSLSSKGNQHFPNWRYYKNIIEKTFQEQIYFCLVPGLMDLPPPDEFPSASSLGRC